MYCLVARLSSRILPGQHSPRSENPRGGILTEFDETERLARRQVFYPMSDNLLHTHPLAAAGNP
jgi:hypothetical protein